MAKASGWAVEVPVDSASSTVDFNSSAQTLAQPWSRRSWGMIRQWIPHLGDQKLLDKFGCFGIQIVTLDHENDEKVKVIEKILMAFGLPCLFPGVHVFDVPTWIICQMKLLMEYYFSNKIGLLKSKPGNSDSFPKYTVYYTLKFNIIK